MITEKILNGFRVKYSHIHPIIIQRTVDKAKSLGEMFDILEDFPAKYPVVWSSSKRRWIETDDLTQMDNFDTTLGDL